MTDSFAEVCVDDGGDGIDADNYSINDKISPSDQSQAPQSFRKHLPDSEAGDPCDINHSQRRSTRLVSESFDVDDLPKPLVECGCGSCHDGYDPLANRSGFRDFSYAQNQCDDPRAVTVERAGEIYVRYQKSADNDGNRYSLLQKCRKQQYKYMRAESRLRRRMHDPTLIFLSLRVSPIRIECGKREWVNPVVLDNRISDAWGNVKSVLDYQLKDFWWEYCWVTAGTDSAATPHRHVLIYVKDSNNEVTVDMVRAAVESFKRNAKGAERASHAVTAGESDAGMLFHDPPLAEQSMANRDYEVHGALSRITTVHLYYALNQRPHWALKNVYDGDEQTDSGSVDVQAAAIAWASNNHWIGSSDGFPTSAFVD